MACTFLILAKFQLFKTFLIEDINTSPVVDLIHPILELQKCKKSVLKQVGSYTQKYTDITQSTPVYLYLKFWKGKRGKMFLNHTDASY